MGSRVNVYMPRARTEDLVVSDALAGELLIYDLTSHRAVCLNENAMRVWRLCDGQHTELEIAAKLDGKLNVAVREDMVRLAVDRLARADLLEGGARPHAMLSRRAAAARLGWATLGAIPLVTSVLVPEARAATSCVAPGQPCPTEDGVDCCNRAGCSAEPGFPFGLCN